MKILSDSYLYQTVDYNKVIFSYIMSSDRIDRSSNSFFDVEYAVKKQGQLILSKVLKSNKVVLMVSPKGISRLFKVIYAKDVKDTSNEKKVFIDCTGVIDVDGTTYTCKKPGVLISYLTAAMIYIIYYNKPAVILNNTTVVKTGAEAFVDLFLYTLERMKVPVTYMDNKEKMSFSLAEYFLASVLGITQKDTIFNMAKKVSGIKETKSCEYLHTLFGITVGEEGWNIKDYLTKFAEVFLDQKETDLNSPYKNRTALTVDALAQRWMYSFGPGTIFGLECFVPFAQILTDCYNGSYINQQNTIEKVAGSKNITSFTTELLKIGSDNS